MARCLLSDAAIRHIHSKPAGPDIGAADPEDGTARCDERAESQGAV